jgi:RimJ/RimL family protein N-acetyltransferase
MAVLEGTLVRLRPLAPADYPRVFAWYNDPEIVAPFDRFSVDTFDAFSAGVASAAGDPTSLAPRFVIEPRDTGKVVGVVGYYRAHPVLEYTDVWYVLGDHEARGRGFGRESVRLLTDFLFATSPLERVGATCDVENVPSYRLLEGLGFRHEGTLKAALFHHGRWHDVRVYGVTRTEWEARPSRE